MSKYCNLFIISAHSIKLTFVDVEDSRDKEEGAIQDKEQKTTWWKWRHMPLRLTFLYWYIEVSNMVLLLKYELSTN